MSAWEVAVAVVLVSMTGAAWFRWETSQFRRRFTWLNTNALEAAAAVVGADGIVIEGSTFYDVVSRKVVLSGDLAGRRDVEAVGIALHECGHAEQHKRLGTPIFYSFSLIPAVCFIVAWVDLFYPVPLGAGLVVSLVILRALVELDAWMLAAELAKRIRIPPPPLRLVAASLMSYL